ncbi:SPFH domain-containing protein [Streptosporangium sp. NPDC051022]|uniref:SPFH domain-containing protein n=1 Tax=Streptosporangium sp. NPDC051022 TaxID=3155752 RepID=UPI003437E96B
MIVFTVVVLLLAGAVGGAIAVGRLGMGGRWLGYQMVPPDHVGIVERRYGRVNQDGRFRRITPYDTRGLQARSLMPGQNYWLPPWLYRVEVVPRVDVPAGMIGLVTAQEGAKRSPSRTLGKYVECDSFQDGGAFLLNGGEQGRQLAILRGDNSYYINTSLFTVEFAPRTHVPTGTIGLVVARSGGVRPPDQPFSRHVECDNFQDGDAFLLNGGEQGKQMAILAGGTSYDINPLLFEVTTVDTVGGSPDGLTADHLKEIAIPVGHTGVVITLDGREPGRGEEGVGPLVPDHRSFRLPWVFLANGGRRGVQEETLGEGSVYALNPWFVRVVLIPTRLLILEWTKKDVSQSGNFDAALGQIVVNIQGHRLQVEMSQTLQIPDRAAPKLVSRFGDTATSGSGLGGLVINPGPVQRFVERVLGGAVETYFNAIAAASTIDEFLTMYDSTRMELASQVCQALDEWGVEAASTTLGEFESENPELDLARQRIFAEQMRGKELSEQAKNKLIEARIQKIQNATDKEIRLLDVAVLERQIELLGRDTVAMRMFLNELKEMKVPEMISGDAGALLEYLPMQRALEMIGVARQRAEQVALPAEQTERSEDSEDD